MGKPLGNIIEVKPFEKETELAGYVVSVENEHMPEKGRVISAGKDVKEKELKPGVDILFMKGGYSKVNINGEDVLLMEEKKVFYIL